MQNQRIKDEDFCIYEHMNTTFSPYHTKWRNVPKAIAVKGPMIYIKHYMV